MTRRFTGWHMTGILVGFFAVVVSVNIFMARAAIGTFGGKVVENSYVASQKFNGWLDEAEAQKALGWQVRAAMLPDRRVSVAATSAAMPLAGAEIAATARHPLGRAPDRDLLFVAKGERWESSTALPPGRWRVHVTVRQGANQFQMIETVQ